LDWLTLSPSSLEAALTAKTRAILVMHYAGFPCDMKAIIEIARRHNLVVLEDSAHAIGSSLENHTLGTWGTVGCYSFFSNKNMTTGEGGMLVTDDDDLVEKLRLLRSHGMTSLSWDRHQGHASGYDVVELGFNYRIDEIRSAIGRVQLRKLAAGNEHRAKLTALYRELLGELIPQAQMPFKEIRGTSCCHILPVILPAGVDRNKVMEFLKKRGIQTSIHYPPIHRFSTYEDDWKKRSIPLPITEEACSRELTLPLFSSMKADQVHLVVECLKEVLN